MLTFDWTITLGTLISALMIVAGTWAAISRLYGLLDKRLSVFEQTLNSHASTLLQHDQKMNKQDDMMGRISGDLHRLIGRMEAWTDQRTKQ